MSRPRPTAPSRRLAATAAVSAGLAGLVVAATPAGAHELPAGGALDGLAHPVLGLDHLLAMVAVGVLAALVATRSATGSTRPAWRVPAAFVVGMVAGGAVGLAGVGFPGVEWVIGGSVVAFGALVASGLSRGVAGRPALALVALALVVGAAHGHAHGTEAPAGATTALYVAGFVAATAALHLVGTVVGLALGRSERARVAAGTGVAALGAVLLVGG
jgi:urease accessory protein